MSKKLWFLKNNGINTHSPEYYEMTYEKFGDQLTMVFMAPNIKKARIKAKSILRNYNGDKILDIRELNSKRLGPDISWNKEGTKYARFQTRHRKLRIRFKDNRISKSNNHSKG